MWRRRREELAIAIVAAALTVPITIWSDWRLSQRQEDTSKELTEQQERNEQMRTEQQEILENLRFVRERAGQPVLPKPFASFNLASTSLSGLDLSCSDTDPAARCTDLTDAILRDANCDPPT